MKKTKEDNILIRIDKSFKEEFRLYCKMDMSKKILNLMERELKEEKHSIFNSFLSSIDDNRYILSAFTAALDDIFYYKSNGDSDNIMIEKVKKFMYEKFDIKEASIDLFFQKVYFDIYKADYHLLHEHRQIIINTINDILNIKGE